MPRDLVTTGRAKNQGCATNELEAYVRHSAASNGFGAAEVGLHELDAEPHGAASFCETVVVARDELLCVQDGFGVLLRLHQGVVWLTQENAPTDVVLREGESFLLDRDGVAVVEALRAATITLNATSRAPGLAIFRAQEAATPGWPDFTHALVSWVLASWRRRYRSSRGMPLPRLIHAPKAVQP
jgi:hypothetical protein